MLFSNLFFRIFQFFFLRCNHGAFTSVFVGVSSACRTFSDLTPRASGFKRAGVRSRSSLSKANLSEVSVCDDCFYCA